MGISIGLVGLGDFGRAFAPLFKSHPLVSRIALCDREPERIKRFADDPFFKDKFNPRDTFDSLDAICRSDLDALVIITQPWLHAPQCVQAMEAGKHVYSAVPIISIPDDAETLDWCDKLVQTVKRTGKHYMLGETTYYRPQAMFCRRKALGGAFGDFVYAEGEYFHDVDSSCNLRKVSASRLASKPGQEWKLLSKERYGGRGLKSGPMHYPTHSCSGPVCVMGAHAVRVTGYGYDNREGDPFGAGGFSNEVALFKMSNGATVRICEMRETPGCPGMDGETFRIFGTHGSFSENNWYGITRPDFAHLDLAKLPKPVQQKLSAKEMFDSLPADVELAFKRTMHRDKSEAELLSVDFQPGGHGGSHPYLVHEFVDAIAHNRQPAINIWEAARYMVMGVMAHKSALQDGKTLDVPDWGDAPKLN
ncbi:MAG: Gfo/Idh/MocA family oxidoreductase [Kiritimatiellae bacterium]|nr:Gfo/Idh/MocA family oxidoreductase [Kiritimatiellia bacterium]